MPLTALLLATLTDSTGGPNLIPAPVSQRYTGSAPFEFNSNIRLVSDCEATRHLAEMMKRAAGFSFKSSGKSGKIVFRQKNDTVRLRPDWYWMKVTTKEILVEYSNEAGAFYAVQTLRQLLPDQIESSKVVKGVKWILPTCEIEDGPRFAWRGMMLDESRHFFGVEHVKQTLDRLALLKQNVFHWHLTDDGGWRIQIKKYPNLTEMGAWRLDTGEVWPGGNWNYGNIQFVGSGKPPRPSGGEGVGGEGLKRYGGFYTQTQIKDIVKYAAARHIEIVPEIEMPGHSLASIVSYPELMCENVKPADKPGKATSNVYCAGNDATIKFIENVLDETLAIFPSKFIHIGADEVLKDYWHNCPKCQTRMKNEGLKDEHELQSWFVRHFDDYLAKHGRRLVGWDEILEGGLAEGATVMSWRGIAGGIAAAKAGREVVMSPTSHCYFDYSYKAISSEHVYGWNPVPEELDASQWAKVLGGQYNVWTEWIADTKKCEEMQYPRALAMAEVLWSPATARDFAEFSGRQTKFLSRLEAMGVSFNIPAPNVEFNSVFFSGTETIKAVDNSGGNFKLRYTLDGSVPSLNSVAYKGGVKVTKPCTVTFAYVTGKGRAGAVASVDCRNYSAPLVSELTNGLFATTYLMSGVTTDLANLSRMRPEQVLVVPNILDAVRPRENKFAVGWNGFIKIPVAGVYQFSLTSDDGSILWLNNSPIVNNDGTHGAVEKSGKAMLQAGLYSFRCNWYDEGGANSMKVEMSGGGRSKGPIPNNWLWRLPIE